MGAVCILAALTEAMDTGEISPAGYSLIVSWMRETGLYYTKNCRELQKKIEDIMADWNKGFLEIPGFEKLVAERTRGRDEGRS